ncbi:hypothetical protein ABZT03_25265 [Streptomyces sp. NPDC005574]|uniref:hypothetical protein n=1 Tax=Streptomyces sp. NPDC005574 TaxID=3156891 RepID=UPI0033A6FF99
MFASSSAAEIVSSGSAAGGRFPGADAKGLSAEQPAGNAGALRDPWEAPSQINDHDPDEVTVQLDDIGGDLDDLLVGPGKGGAESSDAPVFVDESGRRSRRYRRIGMAVGLSCAVYAVVIVVTLLSGNSSAPWLPVPGQQDEQPADKVETPPKPEESKGSTGGGPALPGMLPTATNGTVLKPGSRPSAAPGAPRASGSPARPGTSTAPSPAASRSTPAPGTGGIAPSSSPVPTQGSVSPEPTAPTGGVSSSPDPTPSVGGSTDPGNGPVPNGPSDPSPVAEGPAPVTGPTAAPSATPSANQESAP